MEGSVRRRSDDLGPRNRSPVPRFRTARRKLNPAKSDKVPTSQFARLLVANALLREDREWKARRPAAL